ncbi:hypothetical protein GCM10010468_63960 [Actinocorallia longicatena]|uniref:Uncharacterized protein n=1 Tax=Actinocorallia longicatena TaxID=111803 RepID=A0ABP6QK26_9ACTN
MTLQGDVLRLHRGRLTLGRLTLAEGVEDPRVVLAEPGSLRLGAGRPRLALSRLTLSGRARRHDGVLPRRHRLGKNSLGPRHGHPGFKVIVIVLHGSTFDSGFRTRRKLPLIGHAAQATRRSTFLTPRVDNKLERRSPQTPAAPMPKGPADLARVVQHTHNYHQRSLWINTVPTTGQ